MIDKAPIGRRGGTRPDQKSKAVCISKADLASRPRIIRIGEQIIKFKREVRYFGIHFGYQMSVNLHCSHIGKRTAKLLGKFARLVGSQWGLRYKII